MTENNRKQARVFKNAHVIQNIVGMAPGMIVPFENKTWVFLPGVPRELKEMATREVFPYLYKLSGGGNVIRSTEIRFVGIGESHLVHEIDDLIQSQTNPTIAPLAKEDGVVLRLTAKGTSVLDVKQRLDRKKEEIEALVGQYVYGYDEDTIEEKVVSLLKERNLQIAAAESLTGGRFTDRIVSIPGASAVMPGGIVCYSEDVKRNVLNIPQTIIRTHGTVSSECALTMAKNVAKQLNTQVGIGFTGVAGPRSLEGHEAGTVFIAIYNTSGKEIVKKFVFTGDRHLIRQRTVMKGFELLLNILK